MGVRLVHRPQLHKPLIWPYDYRCTGRRGRLVIRQYRMHNKMHVYYYLIMEYGGCIGPLQWLTLPCDERFSHFGTHHVCDACWKLLWCQMVLLLCLLGLILQCRYIRQGGEPKHLVGWRHPVSLGSGWQRYPPASKSQPSQLFADLGFT